MANNIIERLKREFNSKKVLIVGLGLQGGGTGVARFFAELGARVKVTDKKNEEAILSSLDKLDGLHIEYRLGEHKIGDFLEADTIFKGPSVPWNLPEIIAAQKKEIPIEMELHFVVERSPTKNIIGITGTRGKSTTTQLIYEVLKDAGYPVFMAGNIPNISSISLLNTLKKEDWLVLELPSWPLSGFHKKKISPHIAVFTSFYPDHLNYYKSIEDYLWDKKAIYLYQNSSDYLVVNQQLKDLISKDEIQSQLIYFTEYDFPEKLNFLKGKHNLANVSAAYKVAQILEIDLRKTRQVIKNFKGLPYRQEVIGEKDGVVFINDSTSTTPIATQKALSAFSENPIVLILGGNKKNLPFQELVENVAQVKSVVLLKGDFTDEILPFLKIKYNKKLSKVYSNLEKALKEAYRQAQKLVQENKKAVVLFSPGATSFSMFQNEFERGEAFNSIVKKILNNRKS